MTILGIKFEPKVTLVIILGTLLPLVDLYNHTYFSIKAYDRFVLYFIIPAAVIPIVAGSALVVVSLVTPAPRAAVLDRFFPAGERS